MTKPVVRADEKEREYINSLVKKFRKSTGIFINQQFVLKRLVECFKKHGKVNG